MEVTISTEHYDVIDSGCVIIPGGQILEFKIKNLRFKVSFMDEEQVGDTPLEGRILARTENENTADAYYGIVFYNLNKAEFSSISDMINPATIENKSLYLKFCIQSINRKKEQSDKIFFYTWLLSKEPATQIINNTTQNE